MGNSLFTPYQTTPHAKETNKSEEQHSHQILRTHLIKSYELKLPPL